MEAVLPRAAWRSLLEHATAVTDPKSPYQPAKQVYLETTHTHLTVRATDLCRGYEGRRLLTAGKPGAICIDAKLLHETLKSFADGEIDRSQNPQVLALRDHRGKVTGYAVVLDDVNMRDIR